MTLIPIEHPHRLASPAEVEAFYRGLGEKTIAARGFRTTDPALIARLVAAVDIWRDNTISFDGGELPREELDRLAAAPYGYLDVRTANAAVRIWPDSAAWVHGYGERAVVEDVVGAELATGINTVHGGTVTLAVAGEGWPIDLRATSPELALRLFHALTTGPLTRGHVTGIRDGARAPLLAFLRATGAEVSATLELPVMVARELAEAFAPIALDWQARMVIVDLPDGRIHGFLTTPKAEERDRKRWHARIDKALRRARIC